MDALTIFLVVIGFFLYIVLKIGFADSRPSTGSHKKGEYYDKLLDPRWRAKREKILERDHHRCLWCGKTDHLEVHHCCYEKYPDGSRPEPWDYPDSKLMTLCRDCHEKYHRKYHVGVYRRKWGVHYR